MRTAQALLGVPNRRSQSPLLSRARRQLYVDDPIWGLAGTPSQNLRSVDLILMWWLLLGIPLSWKKGSYNDPLTPYTWIGVEYSVPVPGFSRMAVPQAFIASVLDDLAEFTSESKAVATHVAERLVGRVGRIAQVVPSARPFACAMYAAMTASKRASKSGKLEAPPGKVAVCRFTSAAKWFSTLLRDPLNSLVLVERWVSPHGEPEIPLAEASLEFDASPWGGGGVLRLDGVPVEFFVMRWSALTAAHLNVVTGLPEFQAFWELLACLVCLILWCDRFDGKSVAVLGDSTAALSDALNLTGKGHMIALAKEISWRQCRSGWRFRVGHLPSEHNLLTDALSRVAAPAQVALPHRSLSQAVRRKAPDAMSLWRASLHCDTS
jgi:hypothetical protein